MRTLITAALTAGLAMTAPAWAQTQTGTETDTQAQEGETPAATGEAAGDYDASTVLATVNGTDITLGHAIVMRERLPAQYQDLPDDVLLPGIVEQLVDQTLLAGSVSGEPQDDPLEVRLHLENERRGTLAARVVQQSVAEAVDEAAIQAAYDEMVAAFEPQPEFNAAHILVDSEEKAVALKAELDAGADFAELAAANSADGSAAQGGSLGWFGPGQMVPEFEQAVSGMEPGAVAGPVQTQFGWHLIKLEDKRTSAPPPLDQVRPEIENQVRQQALQAQLETLRAEAEITMPETMPPAGAISDTSLVEN